MKVPALASMLSVLLGFATPLAAGAQEEDGLAQRRTIEVVRSAGRAMYSWLTDRQQESGGHVRATPGSGVSADQPSTYAWSACPAITLEEARALLVPAYLAELPGEDGWGHPLELCLRRSGSEGRLVVGIRSPGRDGVFERDAYSAGAFEATSYDADVVWVDGYFVRWPER